MFLILWMIHHARVLIPVSCFTCPFSKVLRVFLWKQAQYKYNTLKILIQLLHFSGEVRTKNGQDAVFILSNWSCEAEGYAHEDVKSLFEELVKIYPELHVAEEQLPDLAERKNIIIQTKFMERRRRNIGMPNWETAFPNKHINKFCIRMSIWETVFPNKHSNKICIGMSIWETAFPNKQVLITWFTKNKTKTNFRPRRTW